MKEGCIVGKVQGWGVPRIFPYTNISTLFCSIPSTNSTRFSFTNIQLCLNFQFFQLLLVVWLVSCLSVPPYRIPPRILILCWPSEIPESHRNATERNAIQESRSFLGSVPPGRLKCVFVPVIKTESVKTAPQPRQNPVDWILGSDGPASLPGWVQ